VIELHENKALLRRWSVKLPEILSGALFWLIPHGMLIVPVSKFEEFQKKTAIQGTEENRLYQTVLRQRGIEPS
jgi:hypothetical protein